jgi:hypothetical protein
MVAATYANGGNPLEYLKDVGRGAAKFTYPSMPLALVPTAPSNTEMLRSGHIVVGSEIVSQFVPHPDSTQVRHHRFWSSYSECV